MSQLYRELETDRNQGVKMFDILERARLAEGFPNRVWGGLTAD